MKPPISKIVTAYTYFYMTFFTLTGIALAIWTYFYLSSLGMVKTTSLVYALVVLGAMLITMVLNYWLDTKLLFMKSFKQGNKKGILSNIIGYAVFIVLILAASFFLLKQGGLGIGKLIFVFLLLYGVMQLAFYIARYMEVKGGKSDADNQKS